MPRQKLSAPALNPFGLALPARRSHLLRRRVEGGRRRMGGGEVKQCSVIWETTFDGENSSDIISKWGGEGGGGEPNFISTRRTPTTDKQKGSFSPPRPKQHITLYYSASPARKNDFARVLSTTCGFLVQVTCSSAPPTEIHVFIIQRLLPPKRFRLSFRLTMCFPPYKMTCSAH